MRFEKSVFLLFVLFLVLAVSVQARVYYVRPGQSIQAAIHRARAGDTIKVYPGVYKENIVIRKPRLTLKSIWNTPANTIIDADHNGNGITIIANGVTVKGFTVRNADSGNTAGIMVGALHPGDNKHHARNCVIDNNILEYNTFGIYLWKAQDNVIKNNVVRYNTIKHFTLGGVGIILWEDGLTKRHNRNNKIMSNRVYWNDRWGIFIGTDNPSKPWSSGNKIISNKVTHNGAYLDSWDWLGIGVMNVRASKNNPILIFMNRISIGENAPDENAIWVSDSDNVNVFGNTIWKT